MSICRLASCVLCVGVMSVEDKDEECMIVGPAVKGGSRGKGVKRPANPPKSPFMRPRRKSGGGGSSKGVGAGYAVEIVVWQYASRGSAVSSVFEDEKPVFALGMDQKGTAQMPSVLYQLKASLGKFLADSLKDNAAGPQTMDDLVARCGFECS